MTIPKLRFKDDNGQEFPTWKEKKVCDIFDYIVDKKHPTETVLTIKQGIGTVPRTLSGIDIKYKAQSLDTYKLVDKNDFIIHLRSFQGGFEIANSRGIVSPAYTILRNKTPIAYGFYRAYFRTNGFINHNLNIVVEGIRDGRTININDLKERPLPFPSLTEQQKISDFLSSYDAMIDNQSRRLQTLQKRKLGLLQGIFNQSLRFRDSNGREFPAWEEKRLGDIASIKTGMKPKEPLNDTAKFEYINAGTTNSGHVDAFNCEGNVVTTPSRGQGGIGHVGYQKGRFWLGPLCYGITSCNQGIVTKYIYYFLLRHNWLIVDLKKVGSIPAVNRKDLLELLIQIPCLEEQRRIADFLSVVDKQIDVEEKRLETIKTIKKGLLQQLFV